MDSNMLSAQNSAWQIVMTSRQQIPAKCLPLTLALSSQSSVFSWGPLLAPIVPVASPAQHPQLCGDMGLTPWALFGPLAERRQM